MRRSPYRDAVDCRTSALLQSPSLLLIASYPFIPSHRHRRHRETMREQRERYSPARTLTEREDGQQPRNIVTHKRIVNVHRSRMYIEV